MRRFLRFLPLILPLALAGCTEEEAKDSASGADGAGDGAADGAGDGAGDGGDTGCAELPFYVDADGDGYGVGEAVLACEAPEGHAPTDGDCDDGDAAFNPGAAEDDCADPNDYNCDGSVGYADEDGDGYAACEECDDANAALNPGADEVCGDEVDNDCDGDVDEADAVDAATWYADVDSDGFGDPAAGEPGCVAPEGFVADNTDCDDDNDAAFPGNAEVCDGVDNDCDADIDEGASDASTFYADVDGDGFGAAGSPVVACAAPPGTVADSADCDDGAAGVNPSAAETCNGVDDDCDGILDAADPSLAGGVPYFVDSDSDGFGAGPSALACGPEGSRTATVDGDCDDSDAAIRPDALELCDALDRDEDCDGLADDADPSATGQGRFYADGDSDGYGAGAGALACDPSPSFPVAVAGDCDDARASVSPGLAEVCDPFDVDENCDGAADNDDAAALGQALWYADDDGDGFGGASSIDCDATVAYPLSTGGDCDDSDASANPDGVEISGDGIDQDCDGADAAAVDYGHTQYPCSLSLLPGGTETSYGWVYMAGVTVGVGQGAGITAELGVGPVGVAVDDPAWSWTAGVYNADKDGLGALDNDEYAAVVTAPTAPGAYASLWRFSADGGRSWLYADLGSDCGGAGSSDGAATPAPLTVLDTDGDGDGFADTLYGGDDCDDADALVYPGAAEAVNGADDDCDGLVDELLVSELGVGDLVITEVMYDSAVVADRFGEWMELYNAAGYPVELDGLVIASPGSGTTSVTLSGGHVLEAGGWFVLGKSTDPAVNGGAPVDYGWGTSDTVMNLSNSSDTINLLQESGGLVIDTVAYATSGGWPAKVSGNAIELRDANRSAADNDAGASWVSAASTYGAGDRGTPGAATGR